MNRNHITFFKIIFILFCTFNSTIAQATMNIKGPVIANSVNVNGDVTISSMTISTLTVSALMNVSTQAVISGIKGRILQVRFSSTTMGITITTPTWTPVTGSSQSITLSNANNLVRISVSGSLFTTFASDTAYFTVFRDSTTNLGDTTTGLASTEWNGIGTSGSLLHNFVGATILDSPGDTKLHQYQVYISAARISSFGGVSYPFDTSYFLLEEIEH